MTDPDLQRLFEKIERAQLDFTEILRTLSKDSVESMGGGWEEPLNKWWGGVRTDADPQVAALYEKLVEHGQVLFRLAEHLGSSPDIGESLDSAAPHPTGMASPMSHLIDAWLNHAGPLLGMPRAPSKQFSARDPAQDRDPLVSFPCGLLDPALAIPLQPGGLHLRQLAEAMLDYQTHMNRVTQRAIRATSDALVRMEARGELNDDSNQFGVREYHATWLECCEEIYDEMVREDEFIELLGALLNSAVRLRAVRQRLADAAAKAAGMPSRAEMRELSKALQQMRRQIGVSRTRGAIKFGFAPDADPDDDTAVKPGTGSETQRTSRTGKKTAAKSTTAKKTKAKKTTAKKTTAKADANKTAADKRPSRRNTVRKGAHGPTGR